MKKDKIAPKAGSSVKALDKALGILELIAETTGPVDLAGLSKKARVPKTTLLRLLNTLRKRNFLVQDPRSKDYRLGWALIYLGKKAEGAFSISRSLRPFLERLAAETGETASLVLRDSDSAVYLDQVVSTNFIRAVPAVGTHLDLYCTASGKLFLSFMPEAERRDYLESHILEKRTPNTITDPHRLDREISKIHKQGYSVDDEETEAGGFCLAAPIWNNEAHLVAAFSITGPAGRIREKTVDRLSEIIRRISADASAALGYPSEGPSGR
jgi:DNA-binding IclR family transcriptional regulator